MRFTISLYKFIIPLLLLLCGNNSVLAQSNHITSPANQSILSEKPTIAWQAFGALYSIDISFNNFSTIFYSTLEHGGEHIVQNVYELPTALWDYLRHANRVYFRVRSVNSKGDTLEISKAVQVNIQKSAASSQRKRRTAGQMLRDDSSQQAQAVEEFFNGFSETKKMEGLEPDDTYVKQEILIELEEGVTNLPPLIYSIGFPIEKIITALNTTIRRLQIAPDILPEQAVALLQSVPEVKVVQPNFTFVPGVTVTDSQLSTLQWAPQKVKADVAWANDITGNGVTIAVLDTGILSTHNEFTGTGKLQQGPDFGNDDNDPTDIDGHGTHISGIAAANDDGTGSVGIAPDATILAIKVFTNSGVASELDIVKGIHYAIASAAQVINMSFGSSNVFSNLPNQTSFSSLLINAISDAIEAGVVVVTSAGNDTTTLFGYPTSVSDAITVAATKADDSLTSFTSHGTSLSVSAPGYSIYAPDQQSDNSYSIFSGTSMAAPIVAGAAALILDQNPTLTPAEVKNLLETTADDLGPSGYDGFFGAGRINIAKALGLSEGDDTSPSQLVSFESTSSQVTIRFSKDMLADGTTNAVNNSANWTASSSELINFLSGGSYSYDNSTNTLSITNSTNTLTDGNSLTLLLATNVVDTSEIAIVGNYENSFTSSSAPTHWSISGQVGTSINESSGDYAHALATDDGNITILFNHPVTESSAETASNYTLRINPTYQGSSKNSFLSSSLQGGTSIDLSDKAFTYNTTSRTLVISGLSLTAGDTFGLALGSGLINSDLNNPISDSINKLYGIINEASTANPSVSATATQYDGSNNSGEVITVSFSRDMDPEDVMNINNYSLTVNGSNTDISSASILYDSGFKKAYILGVDLYSNDGQSYTITVSNMNTTDGTSLSSNNSATGTISVAMVAPDISHLIASPKSIQIYFTYPRKVSESLAETLTNYAIESPTGTSVTLDSHIAVYDFKSNSVTIHRTDQGSFLTEGNTIQATLSNITAAFGTADTALSSTTTDGIVGSQDFYFVCRSSTSGSLLAASTYSDKDTCTNAANQFVVKNGHTVNWDGTNGPITGSVTIQNGGTLQIAGSAGTISGDLTISGGTLDINQEVTISGTITIVTSSTFALASTVNYSGNTLSIGNSNTLTIGGTGNFANTNSISLNQSSSSLELNGSGNINRVSVDADLTSGSIQINEDTSITVLTLNKSVELVIAAGKTLTIANTTSIINSNTLKLSGAGTLQGEIELSTTSSILQLAGTGGTINAVTINAALDPGKIDIDAASTINTFFHSSSANMDIATTLSIASTLTIPSGTTLTLSSNGTLDIEDSIIINGSLDPGTGIVDLRGSALTLAANLASSGATVLTDSSTTFTLTNDVSLTTSHALTIGTLNLANQSLTLGSDTTDVTAANAVTLDNSNEKIITGSADFTFSAATTMTSGQITSSSGTLTFSEGGTISGGTLDITGSELVLGNSFNTTNATVTTDSSTSLKITSDLTLTHDTSLAIGSVDLNNYALTLGGQTTDLTINDAITINSSSEKIITNASDLTLSSSLTMSEGQITSTGGTLIFAGNTVVSEGLVYADTSNSYSLSSNVLFSTANSIEFQTGASLALYNASLGSNSSGTAASLVINGTPNLSLTGGNITDISVSGGNLNAYNSTNSGNNTNVSFFDSSISVGTISGNIRENRTDATFSVVLNSRPTSDVTISLSSSDSTEGTVSPASFTFTSGNWFIPLTATVTGVDDTLTDGDISFTITLTASSSDSIFNSITPGDISVTNQDNDSAGLEISNINDTITEEANAAIVTAKLNTAPTSDVTMNISSSDTTEATVYPSTLTFTSVNWNGLQEIEVTGVDDNSQDGNQAFNLVFATTSNDSNYNNLSYTLSTTNIDNETSGFLVTSIDEETTEESGTGSLSVYLTSEPSSDVTVNLFSSDSTEGSIATTSLIFTLDNWKAPQTITVTGVDDSNTDGDQSFTLVLETASSSDSNYNGVNPNDSNIINIDDETEGLIVSTISGDTTEEGGTATITIRLTKQPSSDVTIETSIADTTEASIDSSSFIFTTANWNTSQILTLTGLDDSITDGNQLFVLALSASSVDTNYNTFTHDVDIINIDDETAGLIVSSISGDTTESGGSATFTVRLTKQPSTNVTIPISISDTTEGSVSTSSLTFTNSNWNATQSVTVTGIDDNIIDGNQTLSIILGTVSSSDSDYNGLSINNVAVKNDDNDTAEFTVSSFSENITESGDTATFTVYLNSQPTTDVTIGVSSDDTTEATVFPSSLTFSRSNWNTAQSITVTGVSDNTVDGDQTVTLNLAAASSSDSNYNGVNPSDVSISVTDIDTASITVSSTSANTTESGGTATFSIQLTSQPTGDVTIAVSSSDTTEGSVSPSFLTFTSNNWNTEQTVTITGIDDSQDDGDQTFTISFAASSTDSNYNGLDSSDVSVTNADDDETEVSSTSSSGSSTSSSGSSTSSSGSSTSSSGSSTSSS
ncbi:MAG: S8 family serine peptidase, partial [SAR324 cluster bacterium]|nr:S8 family serine peptidase [SAR324 cluster bacterium]